MSHDLPFHAEYAKSGRSSCKLCKRAISQDSLRIAIMVQSPHFDGKVPNWFHFECFWKRGKCKNPDDIYNFHSLRWDDQEKIREKIGGGKGGAASAAPSGSSTSANDSEFATEYAKSGRSQCRGCESFISKDSLRVSKKEFESQRAVMYGPQDLWHHVDCFVKVRDELGFTSDMSPNEIKGFAKLKPEDKQLLISKLGPGTKTKTPAKRKAEKEKEESSSKKVKKEESENEKALRDQNKLLWEIRDQLSREVSNAAMKLMLEINNQDIPSGESKLLDAMSDCLIFGALEKCTECSTGQLYYTSEGYACSGNLTEWTKCMHITKTPKRKAFKIPKEFHDVPFLKSYKFIKRDRIFPVVTVSAKSALVSSSVDTVDGVDSGKPLKNMKFFLWGKLAKSRDDLTKEITGLGGTVVKKVDSGVTAVISTKAEVEKSSKQMTSAKVNNIYVVDEDFLSDCKGGDVAKVVEKHSIAPWGAGIVNKVAKRISGMSARDEARYTKSVPAVMKMTVKGGAAVDLDSGLTEKAHVVQEKGEPLTAVLGLVDIARGTNSFYKLQALESDKETSWWVFRAWGRVGTTIGGNKLEKCGSKNSAISKFKELYIDKTGNPWDNRKTFQKVPNKFYPLEIDYGQDEDNIKKLDLASSTSTLPKSVQNLICMIFDVESMKKAMMEFEIDMKKMPLGKLSKRQIQAAYSILTELQQLIETKGSQTLFLDASNRFYTHVPHDFGMRKQPLLDSPDIIKQKTDMLDNLLEIEVAYSLLKGGDDGEDPITAHYKKLKCLLEPLDSRSEEFERLKTYTKNTHGSTHNMFDLEILDVLKVVREGESKMFRPFKELHNRMLLWHGSRATNFAGILSQGLRIAPPEAPVTGYMFGKGVYFADMVSKSANYCRTSKTDNIGILLLCEVALGNMYELTNSEFVTKLPKGKHSTKGVGKTCPDPKDNYVTPDGVVIPMGAGVDSGVAQTSLLYNEYIVYDTAQVNIKYLLKMKFNYKW